MNKNRGVFVFDARTGAKIKDFVSKFSIIDLKTGKLIENLPTIATPRGIYILEDGKTLFVAGFEHGEIEKINLETKERKIILKTGGAMRHIIIPTPLL